MEVFRLGLFQPVLVSKRCVHIKGGGEDLVTQESVPLLFQH